MFGQCLEPRLKISIPCPEQNQLKLVARQKPGQGFQGKIQPLLPGQATDDTEHRSAVVTGEPQRGLQIDPQYSDQTFKHILVPVWLLSYDYAGKAYQLVVNGYTGKMAGGYPKSGWKIFFAALAALLAIVAVIVIAR